MNVLDHFKEKYREPNNSPKVISVENSNIIQVFRQWISSYKKWRLRFINLLQSSNDRGNEV